MALSGDRTLSLFQLVPGGPLPERAHRTRCGSLPSRGASFCEPLTAATGFGWHVSAPIPFQLLWDGATVRWRLSPAQEWAQVESVDIPGFRELWRAECPIADHYPAPFAFLHVGQEPGLVRLWTGLVARTRPGWSLLVRSPANIPNDPAFHVLEGIIEQDWWFGPVLAIFQLARSDGPISFNPGVPLLQLQAIPKTVYAEETVNDVEVGQGFGSLTPQDWEAHRLSVAPSNADDHRVGWYKREVIRRRRQAAERSA